MGSRRAAPADGQTTESFAIQDRLRPVARVTRARHYLRAGFLLVASTGAPGCRSRAAPAPPASAVSSAVAAFPAHAQPVWTPPPAVASCFDQAVLRDVEFGPGASELEAFNLWRDGMTRERWQSAPVELQEQLLKEQAACCIWVGDEAMKLATTEAEKKKYAGQRECCLGKAAKAPY